MPPWGAPIDDCLLTFAAQGSACIYSRKVEHLYALTYSTLDMLFDRSKKAKVRARERERGRLGLRSAVRGRAEWLEAIMPQSATHGFLFFLALAFAPRDHRR